MESRNLGTGKMSINRKWAHTEVWHMKARDGRPDGSRISELGCFVI